MLTAHALALNVSAGCCAIPCVHLRVARDDSSRQLFEEEVVSCSFSQLPQLPPPLVQACILGVLHGVQPDSLHSCKRCSATRVWRKYWAADRGVLARLS